MDEQGWLTSADLDAMWKFLQGSGKLSERKARLLGATMCRRIWALLTDARSRRAVEVAERYADGQATEEERAGATDAALAAWKEAVAVAAMDPGRASAWRAAGLAVYVAAKDPASTTPTEGAAAIVSEAMSAGGWPAAKAAARRTAAYVVAMQAGMKAEGAAVWDAARKAAEETPWNAEAVAAWEEAWDAACAIQASLLRELFGNPFRPLPSIVPSILQWNGGVMRRLAEEACKQRITPASHLDNARLSVLADALEEAGCRDEDILGHLRQPEAIHVRGCFVLDSILGTE